MVVTMDPKQAQGSRTSSDSTNKPEEVGYPRRTSCPDDEANFFADVIQEQKAGGHSTNRPRGGGTRRSCAASERKGKPVEPPPIVVSSFLIRSSLSTIVTDISVVGLLGSLHLQFTVYCPEY